jgi:hypothetical protein
MLEKIKILLEILNFLLSTFLLVSKSKKIQTENKSLTIVTLLE